MATVLKVASGLKQSVAGWSSKTKARDWAVDDVQKGVLGRRAHSKVEPWSNGRIRATKEQMNLIHFGGAITSEVEQFFGQKMYDFFLARSAAQKGVFRKSDGRRWAFKNGHQTTFGTKRVFYKRGKTNCVRVPKYRGNSVFARYVFGHNRTQKNGKN